MNIRNPVLFLAGLAALIGGAGCGHQPVEVTLAPDEKPTKFILILGDGAQGRVKFKSRGKFIAALPPSGGKEWYTQFDVNDPDHDDYASIPKLDPMATPSETFTSYVTIVQVKHISQKPDQPETMHVTQKVGLNNLHQMKAVLDALAP